MDQDLRRLLDQQDWEPIAERLTLAALHQMKVCGFYPDRDGQRMNQTPNDASGYVVDAIALAFEACETGTNKWDPNRGALLPFLDRLVRRLVTDDRRKCDKRPLTASPSDDAPEPEDPLPQAQHLLSRAYDLAEDDLQGFILTVIDQVDAGGSVNWTETRSDLGLSKHALAQFRQRLKQLLDRIERESGEGAP